jgi:hypothetical protein
MPSAAHLLTTKLEWRVMGQEARVWNTAHWAADLPSATLILQDCGVPQMVRTVDEEKAVSGPAARKSGTGAAVRWSGSGGGYSWSGSGGGGGSWSGRREKSLKITVNRGGKDAAATGAPASAAAGAASGAATNASSTSAAMDWEGGGAETEMQVPLIRSPAYAGLGGHNRGYGSSAAYLPGGGGAAAAAGGGGLHHNALWAHPRANTAAVHGAEMELDEGGATASALVTSGETVREGDVALFDDIA